MNIAPGENVPLSNSSSMENWLEESKPLASEEEQKLYSIIRSKYGMDISEDQVIRNVRAFRNTKKGRTEKTLETLQMIINWREQIDADNLLQRPLPQAEFFYKVWPSALYGEDKEGHVINYERILDIQADEFHKHFDVNSMLLHRAKHMEKIQHEKALISKRIGRRIYKHIYIMDLKGLSTSHCNKMTLSYVKPIFDLGQVYYPESLYKMFLVNAPLIFRGVWKMITPWIDPDTRSKIFVLGGADQYLAEFKKNGLELDQIPIKLGGKHPGNPLDDNYFVDMELLKSLKGEEIEKEKENQKEKKGLLTDLKITGTAPCNSHDSMSQEKISLELTHTPTEQTKI